MWNAVISRFFRPNRSHVQPARERAQARTSRWNDEWLNSELPPLDWRGLALIEQRAADAHPSQIHHWIGDIHEQLSTMSADDMSFAMALLLKLERLQQEHRVSYRRRA
jgi:hypothetical protein